MQKRNLVEVFERVEMKMGNLSKASLSCNPSSQSLFITFFNTNAIPMTSIKAYE